MDSSREMHLGAYRSPADSSLGMLQLDQPLGTDSSTFARRRYTCALCTGEEWQHLKAVLHRHAGWALLHNAMKIPYQYKSP